MSENNTTSRSAVVSAAATLLLSSFPNITASALEAFLEGTNKAIANEVTFERPLNKRQVMNLLGCSLMTVNRRIADGTLQKVKIGQRAVRVTQASVRSLLEHGYQGNTSNAEQEAAE